MATDTLGEYEYEGQESGQSEWPEFDAEGTDPEKVGNRMVIDKVGKYHLEISEATYRLDPVNDKGKERRADLFLVCRVLHSVPGQSPADTVYYHSVLLSGEGGRPPEDWAKEQTINFLLGMGVLVKNNDLIIDPETNSTKINTRTLADRLKAIGQFIADIKLNKSKDTQYPDKYELAFGRGAYQVDNPAVSDVPKNVAALQLIGKAGSAPPVTEPGAAKKGKPRGASAKAATGTSGAAPAANATVGTAATQQPASTQPAANPAPVQQQQQVAPPADDDDDLADL